MARILVLFLALLLLHGVPGVSTGLAQDLVDSSAQVVDEIELRDGSILRGRIVSETDSIIVFETLTGITVEVAVTDVVRRRQVSGRMSDEKFVTFDPNATRLLFGPTAKALSAGSGYLAAHELFFLSGAVGLGGKLTLMGGASIIPGAPEQLVFIAPKFTVHERENRAFAVGFMVGTITGVSGYGGILYGVGTFGPPDQSLSVGTGFLFGGGEVHDSPIIMLGGQKQLSSRVKLLTENYAMPTETGGALLSFAVRFIGGRLTTDLGGVTESSLLDEGGFPVLPWLAFTLHFD
ncbi:MAG: hypothetical protein O3A57_10755 [Bacteroidetes bacterium]|nr:hypothetical protein [Bacteroidota bacterium]